MAKKKQEAIKPRFTIKCWKCVNKWEADSFTVCPKCGNNKLDADNHHKATSRSYMKGVEIENHK